jgi:hypothetical protein
MLFLQVWCVTACGKKGPPRPPGYFNPPVVNDLGYQITGDKLMLEWTVQASGEDRANDVTGAKVYRFRTSDKNSACKDCPVTLSFVADIPFRSNPMQYETNLERGYRYVYQVVLYDKNDQTGETSNMIDFIHE